jgi:non-specific serine/threonine protein kinase
LGYDAERIEGDLRRAKHQIGRAVTALERLDPSPDLAEAYCSLGGIEIQLGNLDAARPLIQRGLDLALALEDDFGLVGAYFCLGWLELARGALAEARTAFLAGLEVAPEGGLLSVAFQLEGVACTEAPTDPRRALVLFGAAARIRTEVATGMQAPWAPWVEQAVAAARAASSVEAAEGAWRRGLGTSADRAIALIGSGGGSRGRRRTETPGGLSRRELEVARLVASGLTNRGIAERLFLAERTVESHVDHIMNKLDFSSRAQVAAWVTEHRLAEADGRPDP